MIQNKNIRNENTSCNPNDEFKAIGQNVMTPLKPLELGRVTPLASPKTQNIIK
jgi:hypothetical protein